MYIQKIKLENFRNYTKQEILIKNGLNIFIGNNAQGKTNVIESIYLSSIGKSFRTNKEEEMIKLGEEYFNINIEYFKNEAISDINVRLLNGKTKQVKLNGVKLEKLSQIVGNINIVLFSPDELQVIKQAPSVRRKFFDISISQIKPMYIYYLLQYNKVLNQRNSLLKQIRYNANLKDTIDVWNEKLVKAGMQLVTIRNEYVEKISDKITNKHDIISNGKEKLILKYIPNCQTAEKFLESLEKYFDIDLQKGYTNYGPQKDNYIFYINDMDLAHFGSQGQQRSSILSYKLAEMDNIYEEFFERPILLLDDVTSELDKNRIEKLLENLEQYQTIITCTDIENFKLLKNYKVFNVNNGVVKEV